MRRKFVKMSKEVDIIEQIENLSQDDFEKLFVDLHKSIVKDPIENFVKSSLFMNTEPTPGQAVLFKLVFK